MFNSKLILSLILSALFAISVNANAGGTTAQTVSMDAKEVSSEFSKASKQINSVMRKLSSDSGFAQKFSEAINNKNMNEASRLLKEGGLNIPASIEPEADGIKITIKIKRKKKGPIIIVIKF